MQSEIIIYGHVRKMYEALTFLLDNIYIRFGSKLYRQIVGIPIVTNSAPLVADLFLFCYERHFMLSINLMLLKLSILLLGIWMTYPGCLRLGLSWINWWVSFAPEFQCCYFCESSCLFYLNFNFDFYVSKIMHL